MFEKEKYFFIVYWILLIAMVLSFGLKELEDVRIIFIILYTAYSAIYMIYLKNTGRINFEVV